MKILVDADACPVKEIIVKKARQHQMEVVMVKDTSHELDDGYSTVVTVDKSSDSADIKLINLTSKSDLVVTQDYGVATMALGKGAYAINQNGLLYTQDNIDKLLFERFLGKKARRAGLRTGSMKKRTKEDDLNFEREFSTLIQKLVENSNN